MKWRNQNEKNNQGTYAEICGADLADSEKEYGGSYVEELQRAVQKIQVSREMGERFVTLEELLKDEREEGRREGEREGRRELLVHFLQKLGAIPKSLSEKKQDETDLEQLEAWIELAIKAPSIEAFIKQI